MNPHFDKVIIWGFPLHSHTHSYVHYGWYKAFQYLGYETYWFDDKNYQDPSTFSYKRCLFITEGYADNHIPLDPSNIYFVHVAKNPYKYLSIGARFIDIRYHVTSIRDYNYIYDTSQKDLEKIGTTTLYERNATDRDLNPQFWYRVPLYYEAAYICWATDLLPHEFNFEDRFIEPTERVCNFIGSIGGGNKNELDKMALGCSKQKIVVKFNDPWRNPLSFEDAKKLVQQSIVAPDIRGSGDPDKIRLGETGTCHKSIGYIPCRLFKNISYGKVGGTNCRRLYDLFGDNVVYDSDEEQLVYKCLEKNKDKDFILHQMRWVQENHTYINRVQDILDIIQKK